MDGELQFSGLACLASFRLRQGIFLDRFFQPLWEYRFSLQKEHALLSTSVETQEETDQPSESRTSQELTSEKRAGFEAPSGPGLAPSALEPYRQASVGLGTS